VARKVQELSLVSWEEEEPDDEMIGIGEYLNAGIGAPNVDYEPHRLQEPTEQRQEENEQLEVLLQECQQQPEDGKDQFAKQLADKEHYIDLLRQDLEDANHKLREKQDISSLRQELDMKNKDVIRATEDLAAARATISHQHEVEIALKKTADELNTLRQQIVQYEIEIKTLRQGSSQYEATIEAREKETAQTTKKTLEQRDQTIQELQNKSGHEEGILKQRDEKIQELERDNLCLKETNKVSQEERAKLQSTLKLREQQYQELEGKFKSLGETDTSNYNELRDTLKQTECALELRDQEIQELQTAILDLERNHESSHDDELQLQGDTNKSSRDETAKLQRTIEQRDQRIKDLESKLDSLELQNNVVGIERNKSNHDNEVQVQGTLEQRDQKIQEETAKLHSTLELREKRIEELQNQILDLKGQKKPGHNKEVQGTLELSGQKIQELQEIEKSSHDETAELQSTLEPRDQAVQKLESNVVSLEEANKAIYDENIKLQETLILRDRKIQDLESEFNSLHVSSCKEQLSLGRSIQTLQTDKKTLQTYEQTLQIEIQTLQTNLEASRIELVQLSHHHEMDIGHDFVEDPVDTAAARFATQSQYEQERDVEKIKGVIKGVTKGVVKDLSESVRICYIAEYGLCGFQTMTYKFKSFVNPVQIMEKFLPVWHRHALQVCVVELAWQDGQDSIRSCKVVTDSDPQALVDICQSRGGCIIGRAEVMERFRTEVIRISERQRKRKRYILDLENGRDSRNTKKQQHREIRKPVKPVGFALNSKGEPEPEAGEEQDQAVRTSNEMVT
jgi:myosin heavy subunit